MKLKIDGDWKDAVARSLKVEPKAIPSQPGKGSMPQRAPRTKKASAKKPKP